MAMFWTVEEIDLVQDQKDWEKLNPNEKDFWNFWKSNFNLNMRVMYRFFK